MPNHPFCKSLRLGFFSESYFRNFCKARRTSVLCHKSAILLLQQVIMCARQSKRVIVAEHVTVMRRVMLTCVPNVTSLGSSVARAITDVTCVKDCRLRTSISETLFTTESLICRNEITGSIFFKEYFKGCTG